MHLPLLNVKKARSAFCARSTELTLWLGPRTALVVVHTVAEGEALCAVARLRRQGRAVETTHTGMFSVPGSLDPEALALAVRRATSEWEPAETCLLVLDETELTFRAFELPFGGAAQVAAVVPQEFAGHSPLPDGQFAFVAYPALPLAQGRFLAGVSAAPKALCGALSRAFAAEKLPLAGLFPLAGAMAQVGTTDSGWSRCLLAARSGARQVLGFAEGASVAALFVHAFGEGPARPAPLADSLVLVPGAELAEGVVCLDHGAERLQESAQRPEDHANSHGASLPTFRLTLAELAESFGRDWLASRRLPVPQFLAGDLAPSDGRASWERLAPAAVAALCLVLALVCLDGWSRERRATQALRSVQQALFKGYRELLPDVPATTPPAQMQRLLEARLDDWQEVQRMAESRSGGLHVLNELHRVLVPSLGVRLEQLSMNGGQLKLGFTGTGFQSAEWVREALNRSPLFRNVRLRDVNREGGEMVRFDVELDVRFAE